MPICPNCGSKTADNAIFCDQCGTELSIAEPVLEQETVVETPAGGVPEGVIICPDCGAQNVPGEVFCDQCGNPLEAPQPVSEGAIVEEGVGAEAVAARVEEAAFPEDLYCPTCGAKIHADDAFCGNCGAALSRGPVEEQAPVVEPIIDEAEVDEEPVEQAVIEEALVGEVIVEEAVVEEAPVQEVIVEEAIVQEAPVQEVIVEEAPGQEIIVEGVVVEEAPVEEVIIEEPMVEEARVEEVLTCPVCGANVMSGQTFCASCGAGLQPAVEAGPVTVVTEPTAPEVALPELAVVEPPAPEPTPPGGPYLELVDSGAHIPLPELDELLIGREDEISGTHPDIDMTPHGGEEGGVSRRHARLIRERDAWFIVDLDSTNGTWLNGIELQSKVRASLENGDSFAMGDVEVIFHTR